MKIYTYDEITHFARQIENKELIETKEILMRKGEGGWSVVHVLAWNSDNTKWQTFDKEILMLQDENETSVAHCLAYKHPTWKTDDLEILSFYGDMWEETVEDTLVKKGKM